jgi:hypothetical protein
MNNKRQRRYREYEAIVAFDKRMADCEDEENERGYPYRVGGINLYPPLAGKPHWWFPCFS